MKRFQRQRHTVQFIIPPPKLSYLLALEIYNSMSYHKVLKPRPKSFIKKYGCQPERPQSTPSSETPLSPKSTLRSRATLH